jgi:hypothetical protein
LVRRLPIGAEVRDGGVHFRVSAPRARLIEAVFDAGRADAPLEAEADGYHSGFVPGIGELNEKGGKIVGDTLLILLNAYHEAIPFNPSDPEGRPAPGTTARYRVGGGSGDGSRAGGDALI